MLKFMWLLAYLLNTAPMLVRGTANFFFTVHSSNLEKKNEPWEQEKDTHEYAYTSQKEEIVSGPPKKQLIRNPMTLD